MKPVGRDEDWFSTGKLTHASAGHLRNHIRDHFAMHIGQARVAALEAVGQLFVIESHQMQNRRLQVMRRDFIFDNTETQFVGLAVVVTAFDTAASHPHRKAIREVIAAEDIAGGRASFSERRAAKFTAADDQSVLEQSTLLQVFDECSDGLVRFRPFVGESICQAFTNTGAVKVPTPVEQLHIAHALLYQAAGLQTIVCKARFTWFRPVSVLCFLCLFCDVHDLRH